MDRDARLHLTFLGVYLLALLVSAIQPYDYYTWLLEVAPSLIALPILLLTYRRFRLSNVLYGLITFHALVLILGGHYTYARVPLGEWARDAFDLSRNHYDRFGHFVQGVTPVIVAREIVLRRSDLRRGALLSILCVCAALAVSAVYELVEWVAAVASGSAATEFLGTQGDPWDTQKDMGMALLGALFALFALARWHDASVSRRSRPSSPSGESTSTSRSPRSAQDFASVDDK